MSKKNKKSNRKMTSTQKADAAARAASEKLRQEAIRATDPNRPATSKASKRARIIAPRNGKPHARKASGLDAAHQVLLKAGKPLRVRAITDAAIKGGLWSSGGKTPHQTLAAAIGREIAAKGSTSRFRKVGRGQFAANGK